MPVGIPRIKLHNLSEVVGLSGREGDFRAQVRTAPRYVDPDLCVACGLCAVSCPATKPNPYDLGMKTAKAIDRPFPQAVPATYTLDRETCLNDQIIYCDRCLRACEPNAIDFDAQATEQEIAVGSVIVATGFDELEQEVAWVVTTLDRYFSDRACHVVVDDGVHGARRFLDAEPEWIANVHTQGALGELALECDTPAEWTICIEIAEHEVRVGDRRVGAAPAVAGRAGIGARAVRPNLQQPTRIHARNAAATGTDRVDVDHLHANPVAMKIDALGQGRLAVLDKADIETGTAPCPRSAHLCDHADGREKGPRRGPPQDPSPGHRPVAA